MERNRRKEVGRLSTWQGCYKAVVTAGCCHKDRHVINAGGDPRSCSHLINDEGDTAVQKRNEGLFRKCCWFNEISVQKQLILANTTLHKSFPDIFKM